MTQRYHLLKQRKVLTAGRRVLFASAAGIAKVVLLAGPGGHYPSGFPAWNSSALATEATQQSSANFADLVAKVKPAVISVQVKFAGADTSALQSNSSLQKFFRQFGFENMPDGVPRHHTTIIGEGSGFFISADGYAVTNNHVVEHAKTVQVTTASLIA